MRCLLASSLLLVTSVAAAQGPEALAQRRFEEGLAARESGQHELALAAFSASNDLYASPNSRLMIARSLRDLGRVAEAWGEFQLAAARARDRAATEPRYAATLESATTEGGALVGAIGRLRVTLAPSVEGASIEVQGRSYPAAALGEEIAVDPGELMVRATAPGYLDVETELDVRAGAVQPVSLRLEPAPDLTAGSASPPWEPLGITFGGVAVLGAVLWPVFYALAQDRFDTASAMCSPMCPPDAQSTIDEGRAFEAATNASWISALSFATLSVTFLLLAWL